MISEQLKSQTKELHDKVEASMNSNKIFDQTYTIEDYKNLLQQNALLIAKYEQAAIEVLNEELGTSLELDKRVKAEVMQTELAKLGLQYDPSVQQDNAGISAAKALGILYVIEGSTLGGNVIARALSKNEAFKDVSFNYFSFYKDQTGPMWTKFKTVLDEYVTSEEAKQECIDGANLAYGTLLN